MRRVIAAKDEDTPETLGELCDVFYHTAVLLGNEDVTLDAVLAEVNTRCQQEGQPMDALFDVIRERQHSEDENSYTAYLFREGLDKILKKVGEACSLLLIAAKAGDKAGHRRRDGQPVLSPDGHDGLQGHRPTVTGGCFRQAERQDGESEAVPYNGSE